MDNPGLNGARASLWDKPRIQETLQAIVARRETDPARRKDLFQEVVFHLWKLEHDYPGQRESWYLQRCRRRLQDLERAGHSLDSHKRLSNQVQPSPGTQGMFEPEAADDVRATVWLHEMMKAFEEELDQCH